MHPVPKNENSVKGSVKVDIGVFYTMREDGSCVTVRFLFCFGCCFGFCFDCTALDVEAKGYRSSIVVHVA